VLDRDDHSEALRTAPEGPACSALVQELWEAVLEGDALAKRERAFLD
jgi:hypothetical protein